MLNDYKAKKYEYNGKKQMRLGFQIILRTTIWVKKIQSHIKIDNPNDLYGAGDEAQTEKGYKEKFR